MVVNDKRWRAGEERWRAPEDGVFDPRRFAVDGIAKDGPAREFVRAQHYSSSYPAARFRVGLYGPRSELVGVAVFSEPTHRRFVPKWTGLEPHAGVELGRFVLVDSVAYNGETWFLARALKQLRLEKPGVEAVVSCADPMERTNTEGLLTKPAHWGTIYQAGNGKHVGRTEKRYVWLAPDGTILNERMLSKIRTEDRGWEYGYRRLLAYNTPPRGKSEDLRAWLLRALTQGPFRRLRHPGNLVYTFGLTPNGRRKLEDLHGKGLPYLKAA